MTAWRRKVNSNLRHPYCCSHVEQSYSVPHRRNRAQLSPNVSLRKMSTTIDHRTFAHFGRQIRIFERNELETEKKHDCVAERRGFEPRSPFWGETD